MRQALALLLLPFVVGYLWLEAVCVLVFHRRKRRDPFTSNMAFKGILLETQEDKGK